ncbi:MAG: beta-N-acetylglucosaminidase [Actinomycetota bacterium]|jgi:hypothetical protein
MSEPMARQVLGMVGEAPFAPPPPRLPAGLVIVPTPRQFTDNGPVRVGAPAVTVTGAPPGARDLLASGLQRAGVAVIERDGWPVRFASDPSVEGEEAYTLRCDEAGMQILASTAVGLVRGAATARQLVSVRGDALVVTTCVIADAPVVPLRLLAGWGLYRTHRLDWALEVAAEGKFNRVLYNWWTATAEERLGPEEERLVDTARSIGVELVCELRRQALGPRFSPQDPEAVEALLRHYDDAVDRGFRSFGFLFDDTDHDPFDDELGLLQRIVARLTSRLHQEPEFFFCPRFYWFPGQMDYSWMPGGGSDDDDGPSMAPMLGGSGPRSVEEAVARQEEYQERLAAALPDHTEVYLANWWSGTPADWATQLDEGWTARVGRAPVFWDNQQQNDFRAALVLPMPLHQRPADFARGLRGYCLNSGVPLSAYAPGSVTAGAWAWNPEGYDPGEAFGAAVSRLFGAAAPAVVAMLRRWSESMGELMGARTGMEQHYRGLLLAVRAGRRAEIEAELAAVEAGIADAIDGLPVSAHPLAHDALAELAREVERVRLDVALAACTDRAEGERLVAAIAAVLASRLPPEPALGPVIDGSADGSVPVPGISWALHFLFGPLRAGPNRLLAKISGP